MDLESVMPVPKRVTAVAGCDCGGGMEMHASSCALWRMPFGDRREEVDASMRRLNEYTAALTAALERMTKP